MPAPTTVIDKAAKADYSNIRLFVNNSNSYIKNSFALAHELKQQTVLDSKSPKSNIPLLIRDKIERSNYILDFKNNWDEDGALPISKFAYKNAIDFLSAYAERILDVCGKDLLAPSIAPVKDGSVDLEWNLRNSYLIINFTDSKEDFVYYYLAFKDGDKITFDANGQIERKKINDKFASQLVDLS